MLRTAWPSAGSWEYFRRREWRLFAAVAGAAGRGGLRGFESQNLANTAWAFAKAGHSAPALLDAIATVIR